MVETSLTARRTFLATAAGTMAAIAGCLSGSNRSLPVEPEGDWAQYAADASNSSSADVRVPQRGNQAWDAGVAGSIEPLVGDGTVFSVGSSVTALDGQSGQQKWEYELSEQSGPAPALTESQLLLPIGQRLVALDRDDGDEQWSLSLPRPAARAVTVVPPVCVIPFMGRRNASGLLAYDYKAEERLWEQSTVAASTTAIDGERVYVTGYRDDGDTGILRSFSIEDGSLLWETELTHPDTGPVLSNGELLVTDGGTLAIHNVETGQRIRTLGNFGDRIDQPPAVSNDTAFVGSRSQEIHAVSIEDGTTNWRRAGSASQGVSVGQGTVVVSGEALPEADLPGLAAFDRSDGSLVWEHSIEGFDAFPSTAPVLVDGAVYYTSNASSGVVALGDVPGGTD